MPRSGWEVPKITSPDDARIQRYDCGCQVTVWADGSNIELEYCPMHKAGEDIMGLVQIGDEELKRPEREYHERS